MLDGDVAKIEDAAEVEEEKACGRSYYGSSRGNVRIAKKWHPIFSSEQ